MRNDWQLPQTEDTQPSIQSTITSPYGFLDQYTGHFRHVGYTENEINELGPEADTVPISERRRLRELHENDKFDEEHYL